MKYSTTIVLLLAAATSAIAGTTRARADPSKLIGIETGITNGTLPGGSGLSISKRDGTEVVTCYNAGTAVDRAPSISVIDDWCGKVIGTQVNNGQTVWARYDYGSFTILVSGQAINGCNFVIDGNCNRLLREPVDQCNTSGENGKQGGFETDLCGQWRYDPGSNGSDF